MSMSEEEFEEKLEGLLERIDLLLEKWENESEGEEDSEEFAEHAVHEPEFSGTTTSEWDSPDLEDFTDESWEDLSDEDRSSIADHFIVSKTGFPPETFGDLALPVVEPNGELSLRALRNAKARAGQVKGLPDGDVERAKDIIDRLANDNFEDADFAAEAKQVFHAIQERNFEEDEDDDDREIVEVEPHVIQRVSSVSESESEDETEEFSEEEEINDINKLIERLWES